MGMGKGPAMFGYETMVLLLLESRGANYEADITTALQEILNQNISTGNIHRTMKGLEQKGLIKLARQGIRKGRAGRIKLYYRITPKGRTRCLVIRHSFGKLTARRTNT